MIKYTPRHLLTRFLRSPMRRQLLVLLVVAQVLAHGSSVLIVSYRLTSTGQVDAVLVELTDALISALVILDPDDPPAANAAFQALARDDARFEIRSHGRNPRDTMSAVPAVLAAKLPAQWQGRVEAYGHPETAPTRALVVELGEGTYLWFFPSTQLITQNLPFVGLTLSAVFLALPLTLLAVWSGAQLVRPVERLSSGVRQFAQGAHAEPLAESGALEVRTAIRSFNAMQEQLHTLIAERRQALASIGHDLRTPLTRLRLRLEQVELGDAAAGTQRDIKAMEDMIDDALEFLCSENHRVDPVRVNLATLCETVVSDFEDAGADVGLRGPSACNVVCDINLTVRALTNIIENAVKYAQGVTVSFGGDGAEITVVDTGPGIRPDLMELVIKPFNRLNTVPAGAENAPGGFGLGLAIAQSAMRRQGGDLSLEANRPSGLIVRLKLPT